MRKTITIAAYNRPRLLQGLLDSLSSQVSDLADYELLLCVDGGGSRHSEVVEVAKSVDFMDSIVLCQRGNVGINENTYSAMDFVFSQLDSDWNLYLEDDLVLAPDALSLVEHFLDLDKHLHQAASYCLCNLRPKSSNPNRIRISRRFCSWGFLMKRKRWEQCAKPVWLRGHTMWDNRVAESIRGLPGSLFNVFPDVSRSKNVGVNGVHCTPEKHKLLTRRLVFQGQPAAYRYDLK